MLELGSGLPVAPLEPLAEAEAFGVLCTGRRLPESRKLRKYTRRPSAVNDAPARRGVGFCGDGDTRGGSSSSNLRLETGESVGVPGRDDVAEDELDDAVVVPEAESGMPVMKRSS